MAIFYQNPVKEGTHHANQESTPKGTPEIPYLKTGDDKGDAEKKEGIDQPGKEAKRKDSQGEGKKLDHGLNYNIDNSQTESCPDRRPDSLNLNALD